MRLKFDNLTCPWFILQNLNSGLCAESASVGGDYIILMKQIKKLFKENYQPIDVHQILLNVC